MRYFTHWRNARCKNKLHWLREAGTPGSWRKEHDSGVSVEQPIFILCYLSPGLHPLHVILSAQVRKLWRVKPAIRACEPPRHWLGQWRVDFGEKPDRTSVALVTNTTTLYTFVFPGKDLGNKGAFNRLLRLRLEFSLVDAPSLASWKAAPIIFAAGNPRTAVSSMNNMRQHLLWRGKSKAIDEDWINEMPFAWLPGIFPNTAFAQRLAESQAQ